MSTLDDWMDAAIAELGLDGVVDRDQVRDLMLDLARVAAHGVERPAAPVTTFLAGLAAGQTADPQAALPETTRKLAALVERWNETERPN